MGMNSEQPMPEYVVGKWTCTPASWISLDALLDEVKNHHRGLVPAAAVST
jgi:hypothetical protein